MACAYITDLATNIWKDLGEPTDITVSYIQSKLVSDYFIGKLNVAISTSYTVSNGDIVPVLGTDEQAIYALMYKSESYARTIAKLLSGYSASSMWIELADGDGRVRRASPTELARVLKDLKNKSDSELTGLIHSYRMNNSGSRSVDTYTIDPYNITANPFGSDYRPL